MIIVRVLRMAIFGFGMGLVALTPIASAQPRTRNVTAADEGAWYPLSVTGGRVALDSLGVLESRERAGVMIDLIRRLHFSTSSVVELDTAILDLSVAVTDLRTLQNAIALATPGGKPPTLAMASQRGSRKRFQEALEAAGLKLQEQKKQFRVELDNGDDAARLRARLRRVGVNVEDLRQRLMKGEGVTLEVPSLTLPLPLSPQTWSRVIFEREVPARQLFVEILRDPAARLLYHGLVGLDAETRRWIGTQAELLRRLYRDEEAIRSFALFGPALKIAGGRVIVPGGPRAEQRWSGVLDADVARPDRFVRRLYDKDAGRTAGLYFTIASVDAARQAFLLGTVDPDKDSDERFRRLVSGFADCYPAAATNYPFGLRSHDPAVLLLDVDITTKSALAGPVWRKFWSRALSGDSLPEDPAHEVRDIKDDGTIDAAWLVSTLCGVPPIDRAAVFETLLFAHRSVGNVADSELPDALVTVRARRLYPSAIVALEQAGVKLLRTYALVAKHAEQLARVEDPQRAITALQQFQGAMALTVSAVSAQTLSVEESGRLFESLAAVPFEDERYDGRLAGWFSREWLPAVRAAARAPSSAQATTPSADQADQIVMNALAGRGPEKSEAIRWEGLTYVLDLAGSVRERLVQVRKRQGGVTLDAVLEFERISTALRHKDVTLSRVKELRSQLQAVAPRLRLPKVAEELAEDGPNVDDRLRDTLKDLEKIDNARELKRAADAGQDLTRAIDFLLGHALASWAYAPHLGEADGAALVGGDPALRHEFGVRAVVPRARIEQRWKVALHGEVGGVVGGSLIGLEAALARWSLRRLSADTVPAAPTIGSSDVTSFLLTVALSNPRKLTDKGLAQITAALAAGGAAIDLARTDPAALDAAAARAAMSPWARQTLSWIVTEEADRVAEQFSETERARLGGLATSDVDEWGTASLVSGCLCLRMPQTRIPEVTVGRATDGLIVGQSVDLMLRIASILEELKLPAGLATPVLAYAMRDFLDRVTPMHSANFEAFVRQARALNRRAVEDYLGAIAAVGPLRPATPEQ